MYLSGTTTLRGWGVRAENTLKRRPGRRGEKGGKGSSGHAFEKRDAGTGTGIQRKYCSCMGTEGGRNRPPLASEQELCRVNGGPNIKKAILANEGEKKKRRV